MTERRDALQRHLDALARPAERGAGRPGARARAALNAVGRRATPTAETLLVHDPVRDPLTGHRGACEGLTVAARHGAWLATFEVSRETRGPALRGQLLAESGTQEDARGGFVHALCGESATLGVIDARGEFVLGPLPEGTLEALEVELEDERFRVEWPREDADR